MQQRCRHGQALLVASRQLAGHLVQLRVQAELFHHRLHATAQLRAKQAIGPTEKLQVLAHSLVAIQRELLRHIAHMAPRLGPGGAQIHARHAQAAAAGRQKTAQHAEGRGLAGTIRTE